MALSFCSCYMETRIFGTALNNYGVATISRLLKIIGLVCRIWSVSQCSFAKETYNFKESTNRSHPHTCLCICVDFLSRGLYARVRGIQMIDCLIWGGYDE